MSIGRDIYCDTRLILQKLEEKFPSGALGALKPDERALEKLLEAWTIDGGIFVRATQTMPVEMPLLDDPKFVKDREEYMGRSWAKFVYFRGMFHFSEQPTNGKEYLRNKRVLLLWASASYPEPYSITRVLSLKKYR